MTNVLRTTLRLAGAAALTAVALTGRAAGAQASHPDSVPEAVMRRAVAARYPSALAGGQDRPMVWILADARDSVLDAASGRDRLMRDSTGQMVLSWTAAHRVFPASPAAMHSPNDLLHWGHLTAADGREVDVIWMRVASGVPAK
jgi:hypothetical protein